MHQSNISQQGRAHFYLHCFYDLKVYEESCTHLWIDAAKLNVEEKQSFTLQLLLDFSQNPALLCFWARHSDMVINLQLMWFIKFILCDFSTPVRLYRINAIYKNHAIRLQFCSIQQTHFKSVCSHCPAQMLGSSFTGGSQAFVSWISGHF